MRSCASRGARSPGSARNRSSCSRSDVGRGRAGMVEAVGRSAAGSTGEGRRQDVVALGGKDGAAAGTGRGVLGAEIGPGLEVLDGIGDAAGEPGKGGAGSGGAVHLKRVSGRVGKAGRFWGSQKSGGGSSGEAVGRSAAGSTGEGRRQDVVALGGKAGAAAGIGRGVLGAEIGPGLEVLDGIDDAAAELAIGGAGSVGAVLLKRAAG